MYWYKIHISRLIRIEINRGFPFFFWSTVHILFMEKNAAISSYFLRNRGYCLIDESVVFECWIFTKNVISKCLIKLKNKILIAHRKFLAYLFSIKSYFLNSYYLNTICQLLFIFFKSPIIVEYFYFHLPYAFLNVIRFKKSFIISILIKPVH